MSGVRYDLVWRNLIQYFKIEILVMVGGVLIHSNNGFLREIKSFSLSHWITLILGFVRGYLSRYVSFCVKILHVYFLVLSRVLPLSEFREISIIKNKWNLWVLGIIELILYTLQIWNWNWNGLCKYFFWLWIFVDGFGCHLELNYRCLITTGVWNLCLLLDFWLFVGIC
jgi:hypothetical protein